MRDPGCTGIGDAAELDACSDSVEWRVLTEPRHLYGGTPDDGVWFDVKLKPPGYSRCAVYGCRKEAALEMDAEHYCETHGDLVGLLRIVSEDWPQGVDLMEALDEARALFMQRFSNDSAAEVKRPGKPAPRESRAKPNNYTKQQQAAGKARRERYAPAGASKGQQVRNLQRVGPQEQADMLARALGTEPSDAKPKLYDPGATVEIPAEDLAEGEHAA